MMSDYNFKQIFPVLSSKGFTIYQTFWGILKFARIVISEVRFEYLCVKVTSLWLLLLRKIGVILRLG